MPCSDSALARAFARARGARTRAQISFQHVRADQRAAVTTDLDQIFAGVTGRCPMDRQHYLVDQSFRPIDNLAEMLNMRCKSRRPFFPTKNFVGNVDRIHARNADERNCALARWRGDGCDGLARNYRLLFRG